MILRIKLLKVVNKQFNKKHTMSPKDIKRYSITIYKPVK